MGLINSIETRSGSVNDPNMWINTLLESSNFATKSGVTVTPDTALKISTVYACVTILSQTVASLPMTINRKLPGGGNDIAENHPLYPILHDNFNEWQTSYEAREMGIGHLKLRGNWYNRLVRNGSGSINAIVPMHPAGMQIRRMKDKVWYDYQYGDDVDDLGNPRGIYFPGEVWHVKGFSTGGLAGLSTINYARESMGLAQSLTDHSAQFFGNKAVPGNVLEHPGALNPNARANLEESLNRFKKENRHGVLILEEDMKWHNIGISNKDAQFLELSGATVRDIARWFGVPLVLLQEPEKVATYASVEQFMLSFAKLTIWMITRRIEQSANRGLLTPQERKQGYFIKLNLKGMLEGDFKTRMEGYRVAREGGWINADEIRALEDDPPIPDGKGKIYLQPMNFKGLGEKTESISQGDQNEEGNQDV